MESTKNFFALLSWVKRKDLVSRELEVLAPDVADFYLASKKSPAPVFIHTPLVSAFIHMINLNKSYKNCGRLIFKPDSDMSYTLDEVKEILSLLFNRDNADSTVLYINAHGTRNGEVVLYTPEGEAALDFATVASLWDARTSKARNRLLVLIVDACFAGSWVVANLSRDIFVQSSCGANQKAKDFKAGDSVIGSVFLHNLLMANGQTECFFEGVNQKPECNVAPPEVIQRVQATMQFQILARSWEDFKRGFKTRVKAFSRDKVLWEGGESSEVEEERIGGKLPVLPGAPIIGAETGIRGGPIAGLPQRIPSGMGFSGSPVGFR